MTNSSKPKTQGVPLRQRRKLLRAFRKQYGITLSELGKIAEVSQPMLSQFERGDRDLSLEAWSRVLEKMSELVREGGGNLTRDPAKRLAGIAKAQQTAAKLGASVAQSIHSPTRGDRLFEYALKPSIQTDNYTPKELAEMCRDLLEIAEQAEHDIAIIRGKERFWRGQLDKANARIDGLKDILGLRDKKILTEEAEQQKIDALGLEKLPPAEEETLRAEIAERGGKRSKRSTSTDSDSKLTA